MYPYNYYNYPINNDERFVPFLAPLLLGGLGGAAIVGLSRPRPVYVNPPMVPAPLPPTYYPYNYPVYR